MKACGVRTFPGLSEVRIAHAWGGCVDIGRNRVARVPHIDGLQG